MKKLYLDDTRTPKSGSWEIVRNYFQFVQWIKKNGVPDYVSFDHDLADIKYNNGKISFKYREKTGYDAAKYLGEFCINNNIPLPEYNVHSGNSVGVENIEEYLKFVKRYQSKL